MSEPGAARWRAGAMALVTLAIVAGCAAAGWVLFPTQQAASAQARVVESSEPTFVAMSQDYYVHVKLIELTARAPGGGKWEPRGSSAPDICFRLYWNGTLIFEGAEREDRLIGEWDLLRLDLKDAILSGQVEVASAVNAPIIHTAEGGVLTLEVWDEDMSFDDEAGRFDLPVESLHEGVNTLSPGEGVARAIIDLVPRDIPLPDLLERASNR